MGTARGEQASKRDYVKPYPKEFRERAVQAAQPGGRRPGEIAEEFGISPDSVLRWVKQADPDGGRRRDGLCMSERQELAQLRRDNRPLCMEREIVARAAAWFARESDSIPSGSSHS